MKIKNAVKQFLAYCRFNKNLSEYTIKAYSIDLRIFLEFAGVHKKIVRCDTHLLRDFMRHLLEVCKLKETSVKRRIACLKVMFRCLKLMK